ncbi:unnamed protein product [Nyctereutes procyonoides]|uniref:non-specific serine/threonine protein kinase n=1 Tax=Nyctereutes procyonoides TaxID=34880 RepID=A0A811YN83_NYCPR|nr:unnamed protein product [Nyctereutes procyonoides]
MIDIEREREREREAETQEEGEAASAGTTGLGRRPRIHLTVSNSKTYYEHYLFFKKILFIYSCETERERERQRHRQAPCREPDHCYHILKFLIFFNTVPCVFILLKEIIKKNILFIHERHTERGNLIADFGWSVHTPSLRRKTMRTYNEKVDLWCIGVLCYELLVGYPPFESLSHNETYRHILKDLVSKLLRYPPLERLPLAQIMEHPWVRAHSRRVLPPSFKWLLEACLHLFHCVCSELCWLSFVSSKMLINKS